MQIADHSAVSFDYVLMDSSNSVLDSSEGSEPLTYIHGTGSLIRGLERALAGKSPGDRFEVSVPPEEGYGPRDEDLIQIIPRSRFEPDVQIEPGMRFYAGDSDVVTVVSVDDGGVTVDANHPLAGQTLNFSVTVREVREATADELEHGHMHGQGDHHHH